MPEGRDWRLLIGSLVATDLAVYFAALIGSAELLARPGLGSEISRQNLVVILLAVPVIAVIFVTQGLYDPQNLFAGTPEYAAVVRSCMFGMVAFIVLNFAMHSDLARGWIVLSGVVTTVALGAFRFGTRRLQRTLRGRGLFTSRAVLVGADAQAVATVRQLGAVPSGMELVGVLDDYLPVGTVIAGRLKVLGPAARLTEFTRRESAREVIVIPEALPWESLQAVLTQSTVSGDGLRVHLVGGVYDLLAAGVRLSERNGIPLLTVKKAALSPLEQALKRALDCLISVVLLVLLAPITIFELMRLLTRGSPLLERRIVLDRSGQSFDLLSFPDDLATRSVLIRKIPSLLNVVAGQLSIVGPRPIPADEARSGPRGYSFALRPGVTGLWRQVQDPGEQALLDLYYLRVYSIWLDLQILLGRLKPRMRLHRGRMSSREPLAARLP